MLPLNADSQKRIELRARPLSNQFVISRIIPQQIERTLVLFGDYSKPVPQRKQSGILDPFHRVAEALPRIQRFPHLPALRLHRVEELRAGPW